MELYFDLTDLVAQEAKTARLKSARPSNGLILVDNVSRSSPRIDTKLQHSHVMSEAVYGRSNSILINCNSGRSSSRSTALSPNVSRICASKDNSSMFFDKENSMGAAMTTFKSTLRRNSQLSSAKGVNPFGYPTKERPLVPKLRLGPVQVCPDSWIPSHNCDDFCRSLLVNI